MARLGGYLHDTAAARRASEERVVRRFWHRLPWLLVGLAGALLAAILVGVFEDALRRNVVLAFFVPGIVYMADAVGTQTETLVIRGLSVGVPIRMVLKRELLTGLAIGVTLAVAFLPVAWWGGGRTEIDPKNSEWNSYAAVGGPNQVVRASASPSWVRSPTQATYPSGRINTAVGAVTAPSAGSSHAPTCLASIN